MAMTATETIRPLFEPTNFRIGLSLRNIARAKLRLGLAAEALPEAREAVEILRARMGPAHAETLRAEEILAEVARAAGDAASSTPPAASTP